MKPIGACIFVVSFLMIFASLVRFYVYVMPLGGSEMLVVDVSIGPYQWLGRSPSYHEVLTPVQLLLRLQNHHHHTQAAMTTTPQTSLAMDQELNGHSLPDGGEIVGFINLSSSEFIAMNNGAHIARQYKRGFTACERKTTREAQYRRGFNASEEQCFTTSEYFTASEEQYRRRRNFSRCEMSFISFTSRTYLGSPKLHWTAEIGHGHHLSRAHPALKNFSYRRGFTTSFWILLAICLVCSKVSQLVRSSTQASASLPLSLSEIPPPKAPEKPKVPTKKIQQAKGKGRVISENLQQYFGQKRKDVAASLGVSVSTFKRMCRLQGITQWRNRMGSSGHVSKQRNTPTACETPSHNVQTRMEGELFGQNEVASVFRQDFMGGPIALNTESGLIMVSRPPDQHGEWNASTACGTPSCNVETGMEVELVGQNPKANVFRQDFMGGPIALNTDGLTFPECSDVVAPSQPKATILDTIPHLTGGSSECAFQVKNQSTQFTANPYPNGLVDPHPQIALTQILSENMERLEDRRNLLAPQKEPLPEGHIFGSVNWTVRSCSDLSLSQPMPTIPHTTGCSEYWRNSLALLEEHLLEENDYGSINLTALSCFDPGLSQPMHTIPHTMPTIPQMMPLLTKRQDMRSVRLKATYGNTTIKFPLPSGFSELEEEVSKRLEFERGSFKLEYKDEEGDSVLIACDEDVRDYLQLLTSLGNQVVKLFVLDKKFLW